MADIKVAIVARDVVGTGGGTVAIETANHLAKHCVDVAFITDTLDPPLNRPVSIDWISTSTWFDRFSTRNKAVFAVKKFVKMAVFSYIAAKLVRKYRELGFITIDHNCEAFGADVIVLHNVFSAQFKADKRPLLQRLPQLFNPVFGYRLLRERVSLRRSIVSVVVGVSEETLTEADRYLPNGLRREVIRNGINTEKFSPASGVSDTSARVKFGAVDQFVILFIGHEFERKRLDLVIRALAVLPRDTVAWIAGGRFSDVNKYEILAQALGVAERVRFLGTVSDTRDLFACADVFVLPSDYETWGMVTLEAMASAVPVIMTNVGCAPHVIVEGRTGFIVESDYNQIADRIQRIYSDAELRKSIGDGGRAVSQDYSWDKVSQRYLELIQSINARSNV